LEDYQHSVVVGDQCIKITGQSLDLVQVWNSIIFKYLKNHLVKITTLFLDGQVGFGWILCWSSQQTSTQLQRLQQASLNISFNKTHFW
jgi:hypothetical protein